MPARDVFHGVVRAALQKDGWRITHDPFTLSFGATEVYADLGAEQALAAERDGQKIVVEVKSFVGPSEMHDLEMALGQFVLYRALLRAVEPERLLFLAIPDDAYKSLLEHSPGTYVAHDIGLMLFTFDPQREEIVRWIK